MTSNTMKPITILKLGTANPDTIARHGDCDQWMIRAIGDSGQPYQTIDIAGGAALPDIRACAGVILTGSSAMVTDRHDWSEATRAWLREAVPAGLPVFGICYGHQLLADAFGGEVDYHPDGLEAGTIRLTCANASASDPLFAALPATFHAQATHYQSVMRLPDNAVLLAGNGHDPHHAYRIGENAWGVQFHPEFSEDIMHSYLDVRRERLASQGIDAANLIAQISATPHARALLARFAQWTRQKNIEAA